MIAFYVFIIATGSTLVSAWGLMVIVGIAHHDWWPAIPVMSYNTAMLICFVLVAFAVLKTLVAGLYAAVTD